MKSKSYGFKASDKNTITLGEYLKTLRENSSATFLDIARKTNIDISTLYKLEKGEIPRVNFFMLKKIADYYKMNFLFFLLQVGITNENEILDFIPFIKQKESKLIPTYKTLKDYEKNNVFSFLNPVNDSQDSYKALYFKNEIVVFDSKITDFEAGKFIIEYKNKMLFSKITEYDNKFIFYNNNLEETVISPKDNVKIIGKILYFIKNI